MNAVVAAPAAVPAPPALVLRFTADLVPYARNSRTHSPAQVAMIAASIDEFGFAGAVLADAEGIVAGHGRVMAADRLYGEGKALRFPNGAEIPAGMVPTIDCSGWTPAQRRAYVIADNQIALQAGWNEELLRIELKELQMEGFDLEVLGFGDQLVDIIEPGGGNERDPDAVPPTPAVPHSKPGDVWLMGAHKVICGSSTDPLVWNRLLGRELLDGMWTDPPYNVAYESKLAGKIKNDSMGNTEFREMLAGMFGCAIACMKPGAAIFVAHADTEGLNFRATFTEAGFKLSGCLIWRKDSLVLGRSDFQWQHEPILYGWKPGSKHRWYGGRKQTTVQGWGEHPPVSKDADGNWCLSLGDQIVVVSPDTKIEAFESTVHFEPKPKRSSEHPTMKPVGLIERHLKNVARAGDLIGDLCGGSGSTMVAADRLGMCARLIELDPRFVDVIVKRWQDYTGRRATNAQTGEEFPA